MDAYQVSEAIMKGTFRIADATVSADFKVIQCI